MAELSKKQKKLLEELTAGTYKTPSEQRMEKRNANLRKQQTTAKTEDIAPFKATQSDSWFTKGLFEDGWQFGDITKTIIGTGTDIKQDFLAGGIGIGEKAIDFGAHALGLGAKAFGNDKFADKMENFIKKDLIDEERIATKVASANPNGVISNTILGINPFKTEDEDLQTIEDTSVIGAKTDGLTQSAGQLAGTVALQSVGVPWQVTTGITSFGAESEQAFKNDATWGEATFSATVSTGAELLTESLFKIPGISATGSGKLGSKLVDKLSKNMSTTVVRNFMNYGINALGEGFEEVATSFFQNLGQVLSYEREETLQELAENEDARNAYFKQVWEKQFGEEAREGYKESAIGGIALSAVGGAPTLISANRTGRDINTGLTDAEQQEKDLDTQIEEKIEEQEATQDAREKEIIQDEIDILQEEKINVQENAQQITEEPTYYHGTRGDFETFDNSRIGQNYEGDWSSLGKGFYFTKDFDSAKEFGEASTNEGEVNVKEAKLDIKKPYYVDELTKTENFEQLKADLQTKYNLNENDFANGYTLIDALKREGLDSTEVLKEHGYDGIIADDEVVVFDSSQINLNKQESKVPEEAYHLIDKKVKEKYSKTVDISKLDVVEQNGGGKRDITYWVDKIKQDGGVVTDPIEVAITDNGKYKIYDGHHRLQAAQELGLKEIPVAFIQEGHYTDVPTEFLSKQETKVEEKAPVKETQQEVMTEEEYLESKGYPFMGYSEAGLHKTSKNESKRSRQQAVDLVQDRASEYDSKREELRKEYQEKVKNGEIREPNTIEKALKTAQGNEDNSSVQAARRLLEKRGIDWKTGEKINTEPTAPVKTEINKNGVQMGIGDQVRTFNNSTYEVTDFFTLDDGVVRARLKDNKGYETSIGINSIAENLSDPTKNKVSKLVENDSLKSSEAVEKQGTEDSSVLTDEDTPPSFEDLGEVFDEVGVEDVAPTVESPLETRDIDEVGSKKVKAYQYEHPEIRPYFQDEAQNMLYDLDNTIKGEKIAIKDEAGYITDWAGMTRQTTEAIAYLKDKYGYSYAEIRKGLNAIIEDHGAENIAVAKRIEFMLDERLREGYTTSDGIPIPANEDYIKFLEERGITEFNSQGIDSLAVDENVPVEETPIEEVAAVNETTPTETNENIPIKPQKLEVSKDVAPSKKTAQNENMKLTDTSPEVQEIKEHEAHTGMKVEEQDGGAKLTKILTDMPEETPENKIGEYLETAGIKLLDKGLTVKNEALKFKNQTLEEDYNQIKHANREAVNMAFDGYTEFEIDLSKKRKDGRIKSKKTTKSIEEMFNPIKNSNETAEYYDYMYNLLNIDRMTLESRAGEQIKALQKEFIEFSTQEKNVQEVDKKRKEIQKKIDKLNKTENKILLGTTAEQSQEHLKQYADKTEFATAEQDVRAYINQLQDILVDAGILSTEQKANLNEIYPHYIPAYRNVGNQVINVNSFNNNITPTDAIGKAKGGTQDILPLDHSLMVKTKQVVQSARVNKYLQNLKNTYEKNGLLKITDSETLNEAEAFEESTSTERISKTGDGKYTATVYENGKKTVFEISKGQYEALKPSDIPVITTLNTFVDIKRSLLTQYNLYFALRNIVRDMPTAFLQSQDSLKWLQNVPEAIMQVAKKGEYWQLAQTLGAGNNDYADANNIGYGDISPINTNADHKGNKFSRGWETVKDWKGVKWIATINNFIEQIPRMAEFITAIDSGKSGAGAIYALDEVTVNFGKGGDWTKTLDRNVTNFVNANIQGGYKIANVFRDAYAYEGKKGLAKAITKYALAGASMVALIEMAWGDDEEYEELSDYIKQNYYVLGKYGDGKFIKIPKGRTNAVVEDIFNEGISILKGEKTVEEAAKDFMAVFSNNLAPNSLAESSILAGVIQTLTNTSWYGEDIVPSRLQKEEAKDQYDETTDAFSIWLGQKTGLSPYKIDYLLDQYSGFIGDMVLPLLTEQAETPIDNALGELFLGQFYKDYTTDSTMKNQNITDIYELTDEKSDLYVNAHKSEPDTDSIMQYKYLTTATAQMNELYKEKRTIQGEEGLTNSEKMSALRDVQRRIDDIAQNALDTYQNINKTSSYYSIEGIEYYKNINGDGEVEWRKVDEEELEELNSLDMDINDKTAYFNAKVGITEIDREYKANREGLDEDRDADEITALSNRKKTNVIDTVMKTDLTDKQKEHLYTKYYSSEETVDKILDNGTSMDTYLQFEKDTIGFVADKDEEGKSISGSKGNKYEEYLLNSNMNDNDKRTLYEYSVLGDFESEDKHKDYKVIKTAGVDINSYLSYASQTFKADKYSNGKTVSGSRKNKVFDYINSLNLSVPQKAIMFKAEYNSDDSYNNQIIDYVDTLDISYEEKIKLVQDIGMKVDKNGRIWW